MKSSSDSVVDVVLLPIGRKQKPKGKLRANGASYTAWTETLYSGIGASSLG
jgi:hypothetical protein